MTLRELIQFMNIKNRPNPNEANSVVASDIPPYAVAVGNPCH